MDGRRAGRIGGKQHIMLSFPLRGGRKPRNREERRGRAGHSGLYQRHRADMAKQAAVLRGIVLLMFQFEREGLRDDGSAQKQQQHKQPAARVRHAEHPDAVQYTGNVGDSQSGFVRFVPAIRVPVRGVE